MKFVKVVMKRMTAVNKYNEVFRDLSLLNYAHEDLIDQLSYENNSSPKNLDEIGFLNEDIVLARKYISDAELIKDELMGKIKKYDEKLSKYSSKFI